MTNERTGTVVRALRAIRKAPDTRALKAEAKRGNPYVARFLEARGLVYDGMIHAITTHKPTALEVDAKKGSDSRYGYLRATYGAAFADLWMREREVASWELGR